MLLDVVLLFPRFLMQSCVRTTIVRVTPLTVPIHQYQCSFGAPDYNSFYVMLLNILRPAMNVLVQIYVSQTIIFFKNC